MNIFLLADDDEDDTELFGEALSAIEPPVNFYHVETGQAVFQFLSNGQNKKPNIIFLDINMPEMSGWQCLSKLKNHIEYKDIPVIMYSTSSNQREKEIAFELGAWGFFTKPSDLKMLLKVLDSIANINRSDLENVLKEISLINFR